MSAINSNTDTPIAQHLNEDAHPSTPSQQDKNQATDAASATPSNTEQRILRAAERVFFEKGFAGARTTEIAEAAGVTHAMLHYYFRTKERLFEYILSSKIELMKSMLVQSVADNALPLRDKLRRIIDVHIDFLAQHPGLPRFLLDEVFGNPARMPLFAEKIQSVAPAVLSLLQHDLDKAAAKGVCRKVDIRMLIVDIISLNAFPFIASPLMSILFPESSADPTAFAKARKEEVFDTIWRKIALNP